MRPDFYRNQTWYRQLSTGERRFIDVQIREGRAVEMEHTDDPVIATKIALDHLAEDPYYYLDLARCVEQGQQRRYSGVVVKPAAFDLQHNPTQRKAPRRERAVEPYPWDLPFTKINRAMEEFGRRSPAELRATVDRTLRRRGQGNDAQYLYALASDADMYNVIHFFFQRGEEGYRHQPVYDYGVVWTVDKIREALLEEIDKYEQAGGDPSRAVKTQRNPVAAPEGRSNPLRLSPTAASAYRLFHKHDPDVVDEVHEVWYPGELVKIGVGQDIGYGNDRERTDKQGWYVHDFGPSVEIFRRAKRGERSDKTIRSFPADSLWVLGYNLGFTYRDATGALHEVKSSRRKKLAATPDGKTLVVVGPDGVEFLATGGNMHVTDWIRD